MSRLLREHVFHVTSVTRLIDHPFFRILPKPQGRNLRLHLGLLDGLHLGIHVLLGFLTVALFEFEIEIKIEFKFGI